MNEAVMESKLSSTNMFDIGVTVDGTCQRMGFSSISGVVVATSVDNGNIMDLEPLSRYCRPCCIMTKSLQDNEQGLVAWKTSHQEVCKLNSSAPAMEPEGAKRIFELSIQKRGMRYMKFYGNSDSKAFNDVQHVHGDEKVEKQECIGHYQKRVGSRLRKLKKRERFEGT